MKLQPHNLKPLVINNNCGGNCKILLNNEIDENKMAFLRYYF